MKKHTQFTTRFTLTYPVGQSLWGGAMFENEEIAAMILRLHGGISMADAVKLVRQERSALEGKARTSGTKDFWNRGWTDGELESASIEAYHRLMKEKKRAEEVERNRIRQERIAQQNHRRPSWASDPNGY